MKWYLAKIIYQIQNCSNNGLAQFEDQLRLIASSNDTAALHKARNIGLQEQLSFISNNDQLIKWVFINVSELYCISEYLDGAELYSNITEVSNANGYINMVNDKALALLQTPLRKQLNLI